MIVVMEPGATAEDLATVEQRLAGLGLSTTRIPADTASAFLVAGDLGDDLVAVARELPRVAEVVRVSEPYRLASRRFRPESTVVSGPWGNIGGERPWLAMEPVGLAAARPGDDEPPPSAELRYEVAAGRPFDAAVLRTRRIPESIGALTCLSLHPRATYERWPLRFVERAPSWGANQWIGAAERELTRNEGGVVLLEAGGEYPNGARTLEVAAIARAKQRTHLPIVVDVPVIAQRARYTAAVAQAALAAGADGVILRVWVGSEHDWPRVPATSSWSDAVELGETLRRLAAALR